VIRLNRSRDWWRRACAVIPRGTQTLSKGPTQFVQGVSPIYLVRGKGAHVWDVDGNEFIDYPMALGPIILGYADQRVNDAIRHQLDDGITFTLMHPLEVEVSERIVGLCPGVEAVRFCKTGSEALSAAVRASRAITRRDHLLVGGYHGWHDWYIGTTDQSRGVPAAVRHLTSTFTFNDLESLRRAFRECPGEVAGVVLEPSGAEVPAPGFLDSVVDLCRQHGAVSIFDEVITGFRLAPGGARERYGVVPDLSCYGKALGNGMPIAAVAGSWETMKIFEEVFVSGTHGGEALSLAAAAAVLDVIADGSVLQRIERLGMDLQLGIADLIRTHAVADRVSLGGEPQRTVLGTRGDDPLTAKSWIQQCLVEHGVLFNGSMFICASHTDKDVQVALDALDIALDAVSKQDNLRALLKGPRVEAVFRTP
jgi:glutamate-1-semialdehyde aminotransferase